MTFNNLLSYIFYKQSAVKSVLGLPYPQMFHHIYKNNYGPIIASDKFLNKIYFNTVFDLN